MSVFTVKFLPYPLSLRTGEGEGEGYTPYFYAYKDSLFSIFYPTIVSHSGLDPEFVSEWLRATVIVTSLQMLRPEGETFTSCPFLL